MEARGLFKNAGIITFGALISRFLGLAREITYANKFGTTGARDALRVGSYIPVTLSNLLVAGAVSAVFIPLFTRYVFQGKKEDLKEIFAVVVNQFTLLMIGLVIGLTLLSPVIIQIQAPGFEVERYQMALQVFRIALPSVYFLGLAALSAGTLNSLKVFGVPTMGGIVFNAAIVFITIFFADSMGVVSVAYALVIGSIGQFLIQYIWIERFGLGYRFTKKLTHPAMKEIYALILPVLIGSGVNYLAPFIETFFSSFLSEGMPGALDYAFKTSQFPIGIFALAISAVVFPSLSENIICNDKQALEKNLAWALKFILLIIVPATAGLMVLSAPIVRVMLQHGKFGVDSTMMTSKALFWYSTALIPWSVTAVLVKIFYSYHDTKTPVFVALITVLFLFCADWILVKCLSYQGLAIGSAIAAYVNASILWFIVKKKYNCIRWLCVARTMVLTTTASLVMTGVLYYLSAHIIPTFFSLESKLHQTWEVLLLLVVGVFVYGSLLFLFGRRDIKEVIGK